MNDRQILLPAPMPHTREILLSPARHKVLVCGRRWAKTSTAKIACVEGHGAFRGQHPGVLQGATIAWIPPTYKHVVKLWREVKEILEPISTYKSEEEHLIEVPGGGTLLIRSGENKDALRGFKLNGVVFDEHASQRAEIWAQEVSAALSDTQGWAFFLGTPKGRDNHFYEIFERAKDLDGWERWQRPSSDNPLMTPEELRARRRELGPFAFAREYLAEFNVAEGDFFKGDWLRSYDKLSPGTISLPGFNRTINVQDLRRFAVVDLAITTKTRSDWTAVLVCGQGPDGLLYVLDLVRKKLDGPQIVPHLREILSAWRCPQLWMEKRGMQNFFVEEARRAGLPVRELETDADKVTRAIPAQAAMEGGRVWFPRTAPWLEDFKAELFAFPDPSMKDDQVDVLAYAVQVARGGSAGSGAPLGGRSAPLGGRSAPRGLGFPGLDVERPS